MATSQLLETENDTNYSVYYQQQVLSVYPTEWVIRAFRGAYPNLAIDHSSLAGKRILDLGFGDGRNIPLLAELGLEVHGVEVTSNICTNITEKMAKIGITVKAKVGRNSSLPYDDNFFDHILACSSCYYMDEGQKYFDNLEEIARIMKSGGLFVHCLPMPTTFIMEDAVDTGEGHMRITKDPYGVRVGALLKKFDTDTEVREALEPLFTDIRIGTCKADYWGDKVHLWLVVCTRK